MYPFHFLKTIVLIMNLISVAWRPITLEGSSFYFCQISYLLFQYAFQSTLFLKGFELLLTLGKSQNIIEKKKRGPKCSLITQCFAKLLGHCLPCMIYQKGTLLLSLRGEMCKCDREKMCFQGMKTRRRAQHTENQFTDLWLLPSGIGGLHTLLLWDSIRQEPVDFSQLGEFLFFITRVFVIEILIPPFSSYLIFKYKT